MGKMIHIALAIAASALLAGCSREVPEPSPRGAAGGSPVLAVAPHLVAAPESLKGITKAREDTDPDIAAGDLVNAREALRENIMSTLDVFVKRSDDADGDYWFKVYRLSASDTGVITDPSNSESLLNEAEQLLAQRWSEDGYVPGTPYDIYVTVNNPVTHDPSTSPSSLEALKELDTYTFNIYRYYLDQEVIGRQSHTNDPKLFMMDGKLEGWTIDESGARQVFNPEIRRAAAKIILNVSYSDVANIDMISEDGNKVVVTESDGHGGEVDVVYEGAAIEGKTPKKGTLREYLEFVGRTPGQPAWKFVNFGFRTSDIADGVFRLKDDELDDFGDGITGEHSLQTYSSNFQAVKNEDSSVPNIDSSYKIVTYSYPTDWGGNRDKAPYILYSVAFTKPMTDESGNIIHEADGVTPKQDMRVFYYRLPVCNESAVSSLERNNIYIVNAEIASLGSSNESLELPDEQLRIEYHVIPWTDTEMSQEATVVKAQDIKYLTVSPVTYTLSGDGVQSVDLLWYASVSTDDGRFVNLDHTSTSVTSVDVSYTNYLGNEVHFFGSGSTNATRGTVSRTPATPDGTADIIYTFTNPTGTYANGETVVIRILKSGIIRVESQALDSRAVKEIKFRVKLETTGLYEDIVIRHFPLDNIQSIAGSWSSLWDGNPVGLVTVRQYSWNPSADGWASWDGYEDGVECTLAQYNSAEPAYRNATTTETPAGSPSDYSRRSTEETGTNATWRGYWTSAVPQNSRQGANSEANAYKDPNSDYWYWGTGSTYGTNSSWRNDYDWSQYSYYYYRYTTYHRRIYYKEVTTYTARRYYREVEVDAAASTGQWVDWEQDAGKTYSAANAKYTRDADGHFYAKVYNASDGLIYGIAATRSGSSSYSYTYSRATSQTANSGNYYYAVGGTYAQMNSNMTSLNNNQMYVVQISSSSSLYTLGRPTLDEKYQSDDKVVSPAFMIASQLGANTPFDNADDAADLCGKYMEVGQADGTRYVGWRLPTRDEIGFICRYQEDPKVANINMKPVLTGDNYWTLEKKAVATGYGVTGGSDYYSQTSRDASSGNVRCIRDLSTAEIKALNGR